MAVEIERREQALRRLDAIELVAAGMSHHEAASAQNVSERTLSRWISAYRSHGIDGLYNKRIPGRRIRSIVNLVPPPCGRVVRGTFPRRMGKRCLRDWKRTVFMVRDGTTLEEIEETLGWPPHPKWKAWFKAHTKEEDGKFVLVGAKSVYCGMLESHIYYLGKLLETGLEPKTCHHRHPTAFPGLSAPAKRRAGHHKSRWERIQDANDMIWTLNFEDRLNQAFPD